MENGAEVSEKEVEAAEPQEVGAFVGGEIHIIADAKTGAINVNSPKNIIIALGILETAKEIMLAQQRAQMASAPKPVPTILRADQGMLDKIKAVRPS